MKIYLFYFTILIYSCGKRASLRTSEDIKKHLKSNDIDSILIGAYSAGHRKDSTAIPMLLKNIYDQRISHDASFYGVSVQQGCIKALQNISGIFPPHKDLNEIDSIDCKFYIEMFPARR